MLINDEATTMHFKDSDLEQLDLSKLEQLETKQLALLVLNLVGDLREALDRLNQNSRNSSRPPSSEAPWEGKGAEGDKAEVDQVEKCEGTGENADGKQSKEVTQQGAQEQGAIEEKDNGEKRQVGRQPGAEGHSRKLELAVTGEEVHVPSHCVVCAEELEQKKFTPRTAKYVLDVVQGAGGFLGLQVVHEKHIYGEIECSCGHVNCSAPGRCSEEAGWRVELTEWHLVGPTLSALIVCLSQRMLASRARIQEFLQDWLGISLSTSTINQCIHEAGRAVAPLEEQMIEEIQQAYQAYGDETSWQEWGVMLWLWVITTPTVCLYMVGTRGKEIVQKVLGSNFAGWLMSDGYNAYREFKKRLRCWAHLVRKARGLAESLNKVEAQSFGSEALLFLEQLMEAVYEERRGQLRDLQLVFADRLAEFRQLCEKYRDAEHAKTRSLAREFLNDWDTIWIVLKYPWLPLTNNEAERALRHWVIARRISYGTRNAQGTRAFALLASVIETCRKRGSSPWQYIAGVIAERRKGNPAPALPIPA